MVGIHYIPSLNGTDYDPGDPRSYGSEPEAAGSGKGIGTRGLLKRQEIFSLICSLTFESEIAVIAVELVASDSDFSS